MDRESLNIKIMDSQNRMEYELLPSKETRQVSDIVLKAEILVACFGAFPFCFRGEGEGFLFYILILYDLCIIFMIPRFHYVRSILSYIHCLSRIFSVSKIKL